MIGHSSRFTEWLSRDADNTIMVKQTANGTLIVVLGGEAIGPTSCS
jgi:hypothetical protein